MLIKFLFEGEHRPKRGNNRGKKGKKGERKGSRLHFPVPPPRIPERQKTAVQVCVDVLHQKGETAVGLEMHETKNANTKVKKGDKGRKGVPTFLVHCVKSASRKTAVSVPLFGVTLASGPEGCPLEKMFGNRNTAVLFMTPGGRPKAP
ncbi:MAG: hypothetical protein GY805_11235 [Chloroflexi bacterium]|nr:hypothetical protein [Chloroflexota bacterium]